MAVHLKKQFRYPGTPKERILDETANVREFGIEQGKEAVDLMELVLS